MQAGIHLSDGALVFKEVWGVWLWLELAVAMLVNNVLNDCPCMRQSANVREHQPVSCRLFSSTCLCDGVAPVRDDGALPKWVHLI